MESHPTQNGDPSQNPLERLTQGAGTIEADDAISDEGYAESTSTSYVTSIASSIRRGIEENGRLYANYGQHLSALPIDEHEVSQLYHLTYHGALLSMGADLGLFDHQFRWNAMIFNMQNSSYC